MKKLLLLAFLSFAGSLMSQNYKITYLKSTNGTLIENQEPIWVFANADHTQIVSENIFYGKSPYPFEQIFVDRSTNSFNQVATVNATTTINSKDSILLGKQTFEYLNETKKILGYSCKNGCGNVKYPE